MIFPGEKIVLVLQGGGALGAYQAGAFEAMSEAGLVPDWIAGISIGAINGALIAGNRPEQRIARLRRFWQRVSEGLSGKFPGGEWERVAFNDWSAAAVLTFGVPGFFAPRLPPAFAMPPGSAEAVSYYSTAPLRETLGELVDFDVLNGGAMRYSAGSVEIESGNFAYFDTTERRIAVEHVMASGALPPGFPPVTIEGKSFWDGGLVSNTPLQYVLEYADTDPDSDLCVFQVDLFSARGAAPRNLFDVARREKEIRYSSRTRLNTDEIRQKYAMRRANQRLLAKLPPELRDDPDAKLLERNAGDRDLTIVHLINRLEPYERPSMDYEFSRYSMEEHWAAGARDVRRTLEHPAWKERRRSEDGVVVLDLTRDGLQP
jgi:NTE family protein